MGSSTPKVSLQEEGEELQRLSFVFRFGEGERSRGAGGEEGRLQLDLQHSIVIFTAQSRELF